MENVNWKKLNYSFNHQSTTVWTLNENHFNEKKSEEFVMIVRDLRRIIVHRKSTAICNSINDVLNVSSAWKNFVLELRDCVLAGLICRFNSIFALTTIRCKTFPHFFFAFIRVSVRSMRLKIGNQTPCGNSWNFYLEKDLWVDETFHDKSEWIAPVE